MEGFSKVGRVEDLGERKPKNVLLEDEEVVVVRIAEVVHAFDNNCPHQHFSLLHQGLVEECSITCPMHGWTFDLESGKSTNASGVLKKRKVRIVDGWIWVQTALENREYSLFERT